MVIDMCGSLDIAREASRSGHSKRLSQAHESNASEYTTNVHEADENRDDEDDQDTQDLLEILVNRLSRKKLSGPRPASKSLRATMLSSEIYRQLSSEDKKIWKQLSDPGKAMFIKHLPTSTDSALNQRSTMTHEVDDKTSDNDADNEDSSTREINTVRFASPETPLAMSSKQQKYLGS